MALGPRSSDQELPESEWFGRDALVASDDAVPLSEPVDVSGAEPGLGDDRGAGSRRPSWTQAIVLALALAFLGGSVGYVIGDGRPPGESSTDVGFLRDMIDHHEQAVLMARLTLLKDVDPITRSFADEVVVFQMREIGLMDAQLEAWGHTRGDLERDAMRWMGMSSAVSSMPGMQSSEAIQALTDADGLEADRLFLTMMREHHRGGLHMADHAAEHADSGRVRTLARRMADLQRSEVGEYTLQLEKLGLE